MLRTAFGASCMNRTSGYEWHKIFKEGRESVRDDDRCGRSKEVNTPEIRLGLGLLFWGFKGVQERFPGKRLALFKSDLCHFHQDNAPVTNSILVTDYLTKTGINTVLHPFYSPDLAPGDFWLFPKLRVCRYETIEEMKEAVTKAIDTLTQEDFHGAFQKVFEQYKCIASGGDYFERDKSFICILSIKVPIRKSLETYIMSPVYAISLGFFLKASF